MNTPLRPRIEIDPDKMDAVLQRLRSGEIDRPQAAEILGLKLATFNTKLRAGGHLESLKGVRRNAGAFHPLAQTDPDKVKAMADAIAECLASKKSVRAIWKAGYENSVDYRVLCRKVKAAQDAATAEKQAKMNNWEKVLDLKARQNAA